MQLILNTGVTVDINEKMSLNEHKLEKGTLDVQSAVTNGNIKNGDEPYEGSGAGDNNKKLEADEVNTTENELEQLKSVDISSKAGIESLHKNDNELNLAADIVNGKDDSTNNESVIETSNKNAYNNIAGVSESQPIDEEQNDIVSNNTVTPLNHENSTDIKEEKNGILEVNTTTESNNENMIFSSIADETECFTVRKEDTVGINTDIELDDEPRKIDSISDATVDSISDAAVESISDAAVDSIADATVDCVTEATVDSIADAAVDSVADATVDSVTENIVDSIADATVDSITEVADVTVDSTADATVDSIADAAVDNIADVAVDSIADFTVDSIADATVDSITEATVDSTADAAVDSIGDVAFDSIADAAVDSMTEATVDSIADVAVESIAEAAVESIVNAAADTIVDATGGVIVKKETYDVDFKTRAEINTENDNTSIHVEENCIKTCKVKNNKDENLNITIGHGDDDPPKLPEKEVNPMSSRIEEIETVSKCSVEQMEDVDMMPEIENTINSKNDEVKKDSEESIKAATSNTDAKKEHILNAEVNSQTKESAEHISVSIEKDKMETEETDRSDENIDLIDVNIKDKIEDVIDSVKKEFEIEESKMIDIKENEISKAAKNDAIIKPDLMDVDDIAENADVNLEASVQSPSDLSENSNNTLAVNSKIIEPIVDKNESVNLVQDSSDDVIFNSDDDRGEENEIKIMKPKESASTEDVRNDGKPVSVSKDDKKISESAVSKQSDEIIDLDENVPKNTTEARRENTPEKTAEAPKITPVLKLSNTLDILSDDEDEPKEENVDNKCINIDDDDDVMLIDEETDGNETKTGPATETEKENQGDPKPKSPVADTELYKEITKGEIEPAAETEVSVPEKEALESTPVPEVGEKVKELSPEIENAKPLLHEKFLKACKKNLSEMTREELEEFCILKIVESVIDRSSLSEVKAKLKTLTQNIDEYNKKAKMLTKQNRDLQVVLKSVQEDQKKGVDNIVPLKITRSVGMQVLMTDKVVQRRKAVGQPANAPVNKQLRNPVIQSPRPQKPQTPQIPVPRLVPANNPTLKSPNAPLPATVKIGSPLPNGIKNPSPVQKAEKRTHNRIQSVTVDLTDDEPPPAKVVNRAQTPVVPPVRLVPAQNLLAPPRPSTVNSPRKVYIPISGPQGQNVRPGQTIMLKTVPNPGPRQRCPPPHMVRMPQAVRMQRAQALRHPASLPECTKQYQPPNWKALPPAPDLKLAKVENGIVISWKIEGYQEDSYEEIASYQLYAYQETASPPNTALWKKIGDVKALPLPMACTLTQFMAGYKYYFAVRAVDIRSRLGPFSLPGSILLLNKM